MKRSERDMALRRGVTLIEVLLVVTLMGILIGMVMPRFDPGVADQLQSAAMVLTADIDYARGLAVSNSSLYSITFEPTGNRYLIYHSGTNPALETLPKSPFLTDANDATYGPVQIADFDELLQMGPPVSLFTVRRLSTQATITSVEFGSLGNTTLNDVTVIWLTCGQGSAQRYLPISISPITGLTSIGGMVVPAP